MRRSTGALLTILCILGIGANSPRAAEKGKHNLGPLTGFSLEETDRFKIYYQTAEDKKLPKLVEEVWDECDRVFEDFELIFDGPEADAAAKKLPYVPKVSLYMIDKPGDWDKLVDFLVEKLKDKSDANQRKQIWKRVSMIPFGANILFRRDRMQRDPTRLHGAVVHSLAKHLLSIYLHKPLVPPKMWMTAGFGYYMEITLRDEALVSYIDFNKYYESGAGGDKINQTEILENDNWIKVVKKMTKKERSRVHIMTVLAADVDALTPEQCAFMYAFVAFLVQKRSEPQWNAFLRTFREKGTKELSKDLMAAYEYENLGEMEKDWYRFIRGRKFR